MLHHIHTSIKFASLLIFSDNRANTGRRKERWDSRTACPYPLGKCSLRNQIELNSSLENHLFQQFIFADIGADVFSYLPRREQEAHAKTVHTNVVADCGQILHALARECAD